MQCTCHSPFPTEEEANYRTNRGHHYAIDQPVNGDVTGEVSSTVIGKTYDDLDARESIYVSYYYPDYEPLKNPNDNLYGERYISHQEHPDTDEGHIVTVEVKHGDCFLADTKTGMWRFVGVATKDPEIMLFTPADEEAREFHENRASSNVYCMYYRSDFALKLGGIGPKYDIRRVRPELGDFPSVHAKPERKSVDVTSDSSGITIKVRDLLNRLYGRFTPTA